MPGVNAEQEPSRAGEGSAIRLHRRQFVLAPQPWRARDDWVCEAIGGSTWLSHCPELRVSSARDADSRPWRLLGFAVETLAELDSPIAALATCRHPGPDLYASWSGRWILVGEREVHMDAAGLLGCFYARGRDGRARLSSSPALLADLLSREIALREDPRELRFESGISWFPPPRSRLAEIRRLLPSQVLDFVTAAPRPRALMPAIDPSRDAEQTLELVERSLLTGFRRLAGAEGPLWLGLTAGFDSRVMLAVGYRAGIELRPFTRLGARVSVADRLLPPRLAGECGYGHMFLRPRRRPSGREALVEAQSAGHVSAGDVEPLTAGVRDGLEGVSVGGHGFSVAGGFPGLDRLPGGITDPAEGARALARRFGEPPTSTASAGLREWLGWALEHPEEHLDWRDRFFIEQRMAGWLSAKEQVYDAGRLERFPLLNSARIYALLLGLGEARRLGSQPQVDLLRKLAPALLAYPLNPRDRDFGLLRSTMIRSRDDPLYPLRMLRRRLARR